MRWWLADLSTRIYRALIITYPRPFRRAFAGSMTQVFRDQCRAASSRRGSAGVVRLLAVGLVDLLRGALAEHFGQSGGVGLSGRASHATGFRPWRSSRGHPRGRA